MHHKKVPALGGRWGRRAFSNVHSGKRRCRRRRATLWARDMQPGGRSAWNEPQSVSIRQPHAALRSGGATVRKPPDLVQRLGAVQFEIGDHPMLIPAFAA